MYRQILIDPSDRKFQTILWRDSPNCESHHYELNTVTYGTACAPFLAVRCLHLLALDNSEQFPLASACIKTDFYMDDLLTGTPTIEEARSLREQLTSMLASGGFTLCEWASNKIDVLPKNGQSNNDIILNLDRDQETRTLGLKWDSKNDSFKFAVQLSNLKNNLITKRNLLSQVSSIFDPLGLVNPSLLIAKLLIQNLWSLTLGWDDPVPENIANKWNELNQQLLLLNNFNVQRKVIGENIIKWVEIHGFCDASQIAYGACVYIKTTDNYENVSVKLLCAKSRIAPLKTITIPRLELCSAQLLANLMHKIKTDPNLHINKSVLWSDAMIVLSWIKHEPNKFKTFVANRITDIQKLANIEEWHHVPGELNPADIISRGMLPVQLINSVKWWHGPDFLQLPHSEWPKLPLNCLHEIPEIKVNLTCCHTIVKFDILERFSSFEKLTNVVALIYRFKNNTLNRNKMLGELSFNERETAIKQIIKLVQSQCFAEQLNKLSKNQSLSRNSKLSSLQPFVHADGLIRVGGRLNNSDLSENNKHPYVLLKKHHLTKIIVQYTHNKLKHVGCQATLSTLRQMYWPLSGRDCVRRVLRKCIVCFKAKPIFTNPLMSNLPKERVQPSRPFFNCGIDYAGPIYIKNGFRRTTKSIKSYIALFICLATKAVHIELVCDCSSETFLSALRRMVARRGNVGYMLSDNATTEHIY